MNNYYYNYIKSKKWKQNREKILEIKGNFCCFCGSKNNLNIHHINYDYLGNELDNLDSVCVLCKSCHLKLHNKEKKDKYKDKNTFYKRSMYNGNSVKIIGFKNYGYLAFIIDNTLTNRQRVDPGILIDRGLIKRAAYYKFLKCMLEKNILAVVKKGPIKIYYLNPEIGSKTSSVNTDICNLFRDGIRWGNLFKKDL